MTPQFERAEALSGLRHGFFGRQGGVSTGDFSGLNMSVSVGDDAAAVAENRARAMAALGGEELAFLKQVHSNRVVVLDDALPQGDVEADGMVTRRKDVLLGILTADCAPLLLADAEAGVIGAAHAGWRGAVDGILGQTIAAMESLGASRKTIALVLGPTISGPHYEVGPDFQAQVLALRPEAKAAFFTPEGKKAHFDLPKFLGEEAERLGVRADVLDACTYASPERYFSHRYATHKGTRTGRQMAMIGL
ncbi:peptidoglycan editing factor PgeF [Devosia sp.]|uniref:peptidoglycan editing factor PgeF n=1 Tax=Devosia sp. TaxID=1871048 RepID=UPI002AFFC1BA|nr:peptidoglycan editing factor PgeF [Devosia sp.]